MSRGDVASCNSGLQETLETHRTGSTRTSMQASRLVHDDCYNAKKVYSTKVRVEYLGQGEQTTDWSPYSRLPVGVSPIDSFI